MLHDVVNLNHKSGYFYGKHSWMMNGVTLYYDKTFCYLYVHE